jgi:hypothetical protein
MQLDKKLKMNGMYGKLALAPTREVKNEVTSSSEMILQMLK